MRSMLIALVVGAFGLVGTDAGARADAAQSRTVTMDFKECLAIIDETAQEVDEQPVKLVSTGDLVTVRINAADGFVTVSCSRPDNRMTLTRSAVPAAAGLTASR